MSNKNYPSNNYQLPDDSFLYNLDVNDWSMLAHPGETDQPDGNQAKDQEVTDGPKPERSNQEQRSEAEPVQETTATARQTKERVVAGVALAGQSAGEKGSVGSSQTGQDEPGVEAAKSQDTDPKESPAERLASDPAWRKQGHQAIGKVREKILELQGFNKYGECLQSGSISKQALDRKLTRAIKYANSASIMVDQLYSNPGWSPDELLARELLQLDVDESLNKARLVYALDDVHDLFNTTHDDFADRSINWDVGQIAYDGLDDNNNDVVYSDLVKYMSRGDEYCDSGCAGAIALYHLGKGRKVLWGDEPIKKILRIADSSSAAEAREILNDTDKSDDVANYEQKLGLINWMIEQIDRYFNEAGVEKGWGRFIASKLGLKSDEGNMLYRWAVVRNAEYRVTCLSEDELRRSTEEHADSAEIYSWVMGWNGKNLYEIAGQIHDRDIRARERRKAKSSRTA